MKTIHTKPLLAALVAGNLAIGKLMAVTTFTTEHVDIGLAEAGDLGLHWHDETTVLEYEPEEAEAFVNPAFATTTRPPGAQWNFLDVGAGQTYYQIPDAPEPNLPYLGIGAEEADLGAFDAWNPGDARGANTSNKWFGLRLLDFTYSGHAINPRFSLWKDDGLGNPIVWMATSDGIDATDVAYVLTHTHFNFAFTDLGVYELEFEAFAKQGGNDVMSAPATYRFVVPEPGSAALLLLGGLAAFRRRR
ncbi:MAG: choice-of-anchor M domain-containing protein [Verrucomicrobiales bacterium]